MRIIMRRKNLDLDTEWIKIKKLELLQETSKSPEQTPLLLLDH